MNKLPPSLTNLETIRKNQRFATYQASYQGKKVFVKQVRHAKLTDGLRREQWGIRAFTELRMFNNLPFKVPTVLFSGEDYMVTSWAGGRPMEFTPGSPTFQSDIAFFAASLATIDRLTKLAHPMQSKFDTPGPSRQSLVDRLKARIASVSYERYFEQPLIDESLQLVNKQLPLLEARLTHADFTPGNVLDYRGKKTLIDFESTSLLWPRFYDLVNLTFNRMVTQKDVAQGCTEVVQKYLTLNSEARSDKAVLQMNTIAMVRALSMIKELMSEPDFYHNTQQTMTPQLADRLRGYMRAILKGSPYFET